MIFAFGIDISKIINEVLQWLSTSGVRFVFGLICLFVAFKIINSFTKRIKRRLEKKHADKTISVVTCSILRKGLKILSFIIFLGFIGFDTAAIGSVITALGVAIGLALQGSLSNFAGGIVILFTRPFRIGDYIYAQDAEGTVEEIRAFYTVIVSADKRVIYLPNGTLANDKIINATKKDVRRVENLFRVSYEEDVEKVRKILLDVAGNQPLVLKDHDIKVLVFYSQTGVELALRTWVKTEDYWDVLYHFNHAVKLEFEKQNIQFSYNALSVNLVDKK